jgi:hypothetical protein
VSFAARGNLILPAPPLAIGAGDLEGASHATPGLAREGNPGPTVSRRMPAQEEALDLLDRLLEKF